MRASSTLLLVTLAGCEPLPSSPGSQSYALLDDAGDMDAADADALDADLADGDLAGGGGGGSADLTSVGQDLSGGALDLSSSEDLASETMDAAQDLSMMRADLAGKHCCDDDGDGYYRAPSAARPECSACEPVDCDDDVKPNLNCPTDPTQCSRALSDCAICRNDSVDSFYYRTIDIGLALDPKFVERMYKERLFFPVSLTPFYDMVATVRVKACGPPEPQVPGIAALRVPPAENRAGADLTFLDSIKYLKTTPDHLIDYYQQAVPAWKAGITADVAAMEELIKTRAIHVALTIGLFGEHSPIEADERTNNCVQVWGYVLARNRIIYMRGASAQLSPAQEFELGDQIQPAFAVADPYKSEMKTNLRFYIDVEQQNDLPWGDKTVSVQDGTQPYHTYNGNHFGDVPGMSACGADANMYLFRSGTVTRSNSAFGSRVAFLSNNNIGGASTATHETGHGMCGLFDEYVTTATPNAAAHVQTFVDAMKNCQPTGESFGKYGAHTFVNCTWPNLYRPSDKDMMLSQFVQPKMNVVGCAYCRKVLHGGTLSANLDACLGLDVVKP